MSVVNSIPLIAAGDDGYQISRSVRLRSSASAYFNRTPASAGNQTLWTWSAWVKRGKLGVIQGLMWRQSASAPHGGIRFDSSDKLTVGTDRSGADYWFFSTNAVFRDPSAWYHIVVVLDTAQATQANRCKIYVNGSQQSTSISSGNSTPALNDTMGGFNSNVLQYLGAGVATTSWNFDGYLTEVNFIDGQALTPSSFGETDAVTGVWKPKKYAGTYGTNGFYLNFADNSAATAAAIGKDSSGNGNNWTPNNISVTAGATYDSMLDVPTPWADGGNGRGNYATWNPLSQSFSVSNKGTTADGNLKFTVPAGTTTQDYVEASIQCSGKCYVELTLGVVGTGGSFAIGGGVAQTVGTNWSYNSVEISYTYSGSGTPNGLNSRTNGGGGVSISSFTPANGDVFGFAVDADSGKVWVSRNNGAWIGGGDPTTGTSPTYTFNTLAHPLNVHFRGREQGNFCVANFGQRPFAYTPPTGFKALNTQNLPDSTIKNGNKYFDATTWTGDSTNNRALTNSGAFAPDLVWIKDRAAANYHNLFDTSRGVGNRLVSNATTAEESNHAYGYLSAFGSGGFTVTGGASGYDNVNLSAHGYVGWQWKESPTAGFDIVTYTGDGTSARAISHSLGVAPKMVIVKSRSLAGENWNVWHTSLNNNAARILLNTTGAVDTGSPSIWGTGGINPTSTTFQVGSSSGTNGNGSTYVAYLFAEVAGFSKFGSYTGNGSTDGPFIYCGFRPRYVMIKETGASGNWVLVDTSRSTYNAADNDLFANLSSAEIVTAGGAEPIDILSNGFKLRYGGSGDTNTNGGTYIYACFAENPFKNSLAR